MFSSTFRLSPVTSFELLLKKATAYWGMIDKDFAIYFIDDKTGEASNVSDEPLRVVRYIESIAQQGGGGDQ